MSGRVAYLDSSAFVKLVVGEAESEALRSHLREWPERASAMLLRTEVLRAVAPAGWAAIRLARAEMAKLTLLVITPALFDAAGAIPGAVRSLDAIHVAVAHSLGAELGQVVTYDRRLAAAASQLGLSVASPA
ncbi:MAG: type II toxin-antitoxin system VapC family toxin [Candidatus Dormibacteraceae bacterium]